MPTPNPRRHQFKNSIPALGVEDTRTVWVGRTVWSGNQFRRMTKKVMPPTNCSSTSEKYNFKLYSNGVRYGDAMFVAGNIATYTNWGTGSDPSPDVLASAGRRFVQNSGFAETLYETPSSLRMVTRRANTVFQILKAAGRGAFRHAAHVLRESTGYNVSNRSIKRLEKRWGQKSAYDSRRASAFWLEANFGFLPLFQSIYDSLEVFRSETSVKRSFAKDGFQGAGIYAEVVNSNVQTLDELGLTNPALLTWNILPFSFVIDWFLPISTILAWYGSGRGLGVRYAYTTSRWGHDATTRLGVWWKSTEYYSRKAVSPPSVLTFLGASPRSHGLWTAVTAVSLFNALR